MKRIDQRSEEVLPCIVVEKSLKPYQEIGLSILGRSFYLVLETLQFETFSFLMVTNRLRGRFEKFKRHFDKYFDGFTLDEIRIGRALDISLDFGFVNPKWVEKKGKFFREFHNRSEASKFLGKVYLNYRAGDTQENVRLFDSLDNSS